MNRPETLTAPALCSYPFVNLLYSPPDKNISTIIFAYQNSLVGWHGDDHAFRSAHFAHPYQVRADVPTLVDALSDHTFENLIGKAELTINDVEIRTKVDLISAACNTRPEWDVCFNREGKATMEQLCAYLLYDHSSHLSIHWGQAVSLYNDSEPDQKDAILAFFEKFLNRPLETMLSVRFPEPLPENIAPALEQKSIDGTRYVLPTVGDDWVREDQALNRFTVNGYRDRGRRKTYMIAGAATIDEAIAYATRYALEIQAKDSIQLIAIDYLGEEICSARIVGMGPKPAGTWDHALPVRLEWNLEQLSTFIGKDDLQAKLVQTEGKMNVRWSKVRRLEDELGL